MGSKGSNIPTSFVASVSSKTRRLIRHQDGLERWGLTKIPNAKIRAFAIANKGLAMSSPKRSSSDQQKIGGFQKLNGFSARCAEQCTTSKTAYQMQTGCRKQSGHTDQAMLFPAYLLTGDE
jgi:hypothetical protein